MSKDKAENRQHVTLRIKKKYFDRIAEGSKRVEYRDVKPFYTRLFKGRKVKTLGLHFQQDERLLVEVKKIRKIKTPPNLSADLFGSKVYAIYLGRILSTKTSEAPNG